MSIRSAAVLALVAGSSTALAAGPHSLYTGASPLISATMNGSGLPTAWTAAQPLPGTLPAQLGPSITSTTTNTAVAVTAQNGTNQLSFTVATSGSWAPWTSFGPGITTRARPALASDSTRAHLAFHGTDFRHYYNRYLGTSWQGIEPVGGTAAAQSFGPSAASIAAIGENAYLAYFDGGDANLLNMRIRQWAGEGNPPVWSPTLRVSTVPPNFNISPAIVAADQPLPASGGPVEPWDLMIAFLRGGDNAVMVTRRVINPPPGGGPAFTTPAAVPSAFTATEVALVGLEQGRAILAFRGNDGNLYFSQWGNGSNAWSTVSQIFTAEQSTTSPVLARGVDATGLGAQIAWLTQAGTSFGHARWNGNAWTDRQLVNTGSLIGGPLTNPALTRAGTVSDPSVSTTANATANAGSAWSATFTILNAGPDDSSGNDLSITIPAGLQFQSVTLPPSGWTITSAPAVGSSGSLLVSSTGTIARAQQQSIVLNATIDPAASGTRSVAYALTSIIPDPNTANQSGSIALTITAACYANCDGSTDIPVLGAADFSCFLAKFRAGEAYANCDGSSDLPVLGAADFSCFLAKFRAGCN